MAKSVSSQQQFAIVPVPTHPGHARDFIQADAILIGDMEEAFRGIRQSVAHTAMLRRLDEGQRQSAITARQQADTRTRQILTFCDGVNKLTRRMDSYEAELAIRRQREADEAERKEEERIQQQLDALPDPDDPHSWAPAGDLHSAKAGEPGHREQLKAGDATGDPDPDDLVKVENIGDLPTELTNKIPPPTGEYDPTERARQPEAKNPVGISFW